MISPRSVYQFFAVIVVDALAWPVNRAIDAVSNCAFDEFDRSDDLLSLRDKSSHLDFSDIGDDE